MARGYTVIASLEAKPEKIRELKQALLQVVGPSKKEPTSLEYRMFQDRTNTARFVFYEVWVSKEGHEQQFGKPYIQDLFGQLDGLLAKPAEVLSVEECE